MYDDLDERSEARSARELRADAARLAAERDRLAEQLRGSEARVAGLREETTTLAQNMCVILKTVRRELKRKDAQRAELEAQLGLPAQPGPTPPAYGADAAAQPTASHVLVPAQPARPLSRQ
jgi:hypothetical protein